LRTLFMGLDLNTSAAAAIVAARKRRFARIE
jgi:hypothetical protein